MERAKTTLKRTSVTRGRRSSGFPALAAAHLVAKLSDRPPCVLRPTFLSPFLVCQLPVTIDAAFVEFVRTQSLELRVWKGCRASWPSGGTACGVGRLLLRPLLTTLEGVGGDVPIAAEVGGGGGGDRAGSVAARVFFKHRGSGSNGGARAEKREGQDGACSTEGDSAAAAAAAPAAAPGEAFGRARRRMPVTFREEVEVFDQEEAGHRVDGDPAKRGHATEIPLRDSGQLSLGESSESSEPEGAGEEEYSQESKSQQRQLEGPATSLGGERVLEVCVEKAMRLVVSSAAAAAAAPEDPEVVGSVVSPGVALPSTYVTFRWEEEGKPPLTSPLVSRPLPSTSSGSGRVDGEEGEDAQVICLNVHISWLFVFRWKRVVGVRGCCFSRLSP